MLACPLASAVRPRRALLLLAAGLLVSLNAVAQSDPAPAAAADSPNPLLWLLLAGLGIVGLMLIMTVGSAASAIRWSAGQAEAQAAEAAPAAVVAAALVAVEAAPVDVPAVLVAAETVSVAARPVLAVVPVYSFEVEEPVLC